MNSSNVLTAYTPLLTNKFTTNDGRKHLTKHPYQANLLSILPSIQIKVQHAKVHKVRILLIDAGRLQAVRTNVYSF